MLRLPRHLKGIELYRDGTPIVEMRRDPKASQMRGLDPAGELQSLSFNGRIAEQGAEVSTYVGRAASGAEVRLDAMRTSDRSPQSPVFTELGEEIVPEKAKVHLTGVG